MLSRKPQQKEFVTVGLPFVITECHRRILKHTCKCWAFESAVYIIALSSASTKNNKKRIFFFFFMVRIYIPPSMLPKLQPPLCRRWSWCWFRPSAVHTHPKYSRGCAAMKLWERFKSSDHEWGRWHTPYEVVPLGGTQPGSKVWKSRPGVLTLSTIERRGLVWKPEIGHKHRIRHQEATKKWAMRKIFLVQAADLFGKSYFFL